MKSALLIHGFMTDSSDFNRLYGLLCAIYDEVLCPDLPKHGKNEQIQIKQTQNKKKEQKVPINAEEILQFVENSFDDLSSRHKIVDVFGFSMGGALASHLAKNKNVNRLILLSPANKFASATYAFYYADYFFKKADFKDKNIADECISTLDDVKKDNADAVRMFFKQLLPRYSLKNLTEFARLMRLCNKGLKQINCPMLILYGRFDQLVPIGSSTFLLSKCTNPLKKRVIYRDISHYMLYSRAYGRILYDITHFLIQTDPLLLQAPKNNN